MINHEKPAAFRWLKGYFQSHVHGMMTCREFDEFIGRYFDDELSQQQRSLFQMHMRFCRECRQFLQAYERAMEVGRAVFPSMDDPVPSNVPEALIKAILESRSG